MPFLELFDETLDINSTENYEISVQASPDELSFCILDTLRNKFVLLRSYEPEDNSKFDPYRLNKIIRKDDFLTRQFKKTSIVIPSPKSTLVPSSLFDDSKRCEFFAFNQVPADGERILTSKLQNPDILVIFSMPEGIANVINSAFPGSNFMHQLKPLFQYINHSRRSVVSNNVHIHFEKEYMNIVIFDQNTLKFCNTFHFSTVTDIQYYILYVLKKLNIRQEEIITISGKTVNREEILNSFSNYLNTIRFAVPEGNYTFSYVFNETELNKFLVLFSAVSCE
jgi:hypothetical protein